MYPKTDVLGNLKPKYNSHIDSTVTDAENILEHRFRFLGQQFFSRDKDRGQWDNGYLPIEWYLDPAQNLIFPKKVHYKDWDLLKMRPQMADVKYPWELGRCQHWATLAQAFCLTNDDKYAIEIANQLRDFLAANPVEMGVNWTCTMDVGLRAANWALTLQMIYSCSKLEEEFWLEAYKALFDHGHFIYNNLENKYEVTSNHFLSNIVGLHFVAVVFEDLQIGQEWKQFALKSLEQEIKVQVLEDGADYESSIPYHRLVTELFLGSAVLAEHRKEPLSTSYCEKLRQMVAFLYAIQRPDGLMPQVGDADDGRLHIFSNYGTWNPQSPAHLFPPAALFFKEFSWLEKEETLWEAVWWGFDIEDVKVNPRHKICQLFPNAGVAVINAEKHFLITTNGIVGTNGFGNHKHNDLLSFEYHFEQTPVLVDPGSYVYTSNPEQRNRFRGTQYHNTLSVDNEEQNEINKEWLFRLFETAYPEHLYFAEDENYAWYYGNHKGYSRLKEAVIHKRFFQLEKSSGALFIVDFLEGTGAHKVNWHFHFAPKVNIKEEKQYFLLQLEKDIQLQMTSSLTTAKISDAMYSPSYGVAYPCQALDFTLKTDVPCSHWFLVAPTSWMQTHNKDNEIKKLMKKAQQC